MQPHADETALEFRGVAYRPRPSSPPVLERLDLSVARGETLVLLGRSGCGKTTALRLVNRLLLPTSGAVLVEGRLTADWDPIRLRRRIGYVIQEGGLFPHFTVEENIGLVPSLERWPAARIAARTAELMQVVGLAADLGGRRPHELSGGQRQRVGVARALAIDPPLLLLDEPFGALDPLTRSSLQREFIRLQRALRKTAVFVTHDVREALLVGSRIALLDAGRVLLLETPDEFLRSTHPLARSYRDTLSLEQLRCP